MLSIAAFFVDPFVISIGFEPILDLPLRTYRKASLAFCFQYNGHEHSRVFFFGFFRSGGGYRSRTDDLLRARQAL